MTYTFSIEIDSTGKLSIEEEKSGQKLWKLSVIMFLITLSFCIMIGLFIVESLQCRQTVEEADQCGQHLTFFGDRDVIIPLTQHDMDVHCKLMFETLKNLEKYSKNCLPTFPKQALTIYTYDVSQVITKRCKNRQIREKFLEFAKCWAPKEKLHKVNVCVDKHIIQLEYIHRHLDPEHQIAAVCCTAHQKHDCIAKEMKEICNEENVKYVVQEIDDSNSGMTEFACADYTTSDACDSNFNATVWEPLKDIVNSNDEKLLATRHKHKSSLGPIIAIITNFEM